MGPLLSPAEGYLSSYLTHRVNSAQLLGGTKHSWNSRPHLHVPRMRKSLWLGASFPNAPLSLLTSFRSPVLNSDGHFAFISLPPVPPALPGKKLKIFSPRWIEGNV